MPAQQGAKNHAIRFGNTRRCAVRLRDNDTGSRDGLRKAILLVLADELRSERPPRITPEQQAQLVALACEQPHADSSPVTHRSSEDLAREAIERGIVDSISARHLRDILKRCVIRPHRHKYWLTSPDRQDADFDDRVAEICKIYREAPDAYRRDGSAPL